MNYCVNKAAVKVMTLLLAIIFCAAAVMPGISALATGNSDSVSPVKNPVPGSPAAVTVFPVDSASETEQTVTAFSEDVTCADVKSGSGSPVMTAFTSKKLYLLPGGENRILSGDFETTPDGGWNDDTMMSAGCLAVSGAQFRSGSHSLEFTASGEQKSAEMWLDVSADTDYVLSVSLLGEYLSARNLGNFTIQLINPETGNPLDTGNTAVSGIAPPRWDAGWHRRAVEFNSGNAVKIGIRFSGSSAGCYLDDLCLCNAADATALPQTSDRSVDPLLATFKSATVSQTLIDTAVCCEKQNNLLENSDFSTSATSFWDGMTAFSCVSVSADKEDAANRVLHYDSAVPRYNNCITWIPTESNTDYCVFVKIRGERGGKGAFTVVTGSKMPKRLVKYAPDSFDGSWQTFCVTLNTNDDSKIGFAFLDGGGAFSVDDVVFCKLADANYSGFSQTGFINGDAESGNTLGWSWTQNKVLNVIDSGESTALPAQAHKQENIGGKRYYNMWGWTDAMRTVILQPGASYLLTMNYYAINGNAALSVRDSSATLATVPTTQINAWNTAKLCFTVGKESRITIDFYSGWSEYCFDNVTLTKISSDTGLVNGDAETGSAFGWTNSKANQAGSFAAVNSQTDSSDASVAHNVLTDGGSNYFSSWSFNTLSQELKLEPDTEYAIRFCYYAVNYNASVQVTDGTGEMLTSFSANAAVKQWKTVAADFETGADGAVTVALNTGWGVYCFDRFEVIKLKNENTLINGKMAVGSGAVCCGWSSDGLSYCQTNERNYIDISAGKYAGQNLTLQPDTLYLLSFEGKCDGQAGMTLTGSDSAEIATVAVQGDWQRVTAVFATQKTDGTVNLKFTAPAQFSVSGVTLTKALSCESSEILDSLAVYDTYGLDLRQGIRYGYSLTTGPSKSVTIDGACYVVSMVGLLFSTADHVPQGGLTTELLSGTVCCGGEIDSYRTIGTDVNSNDLCTFSAVVQNIPRRQKERQVTGRAYLICTNGSGGEITLYGDPEIVSVFGIYQSNGADYYNYPVRQWMNP